MCAQRSLADTDRDGKMDINEFSIACKLVNLKLRGFEIPKQLPPTMIASLKAFGSTPTLTPTGAGSLSPVTNVPAGKLTNEITVTEIYNQITSIIYDTIHFRCSSTKASVTSAIATAATANSSSTNSSSSTYSTKRGHWHPRFVSIAYNYLCIIT